MPDKLIPSISLRLGSLAEVQRRIAQEGARHAKNSRPKPCITISREFGCEAYPVSERLKEILEKKTGDSWTIMDKALLEEVAKNHNLEESLLKGLGEQPRFLDEVISTFSPGWKTERDHFRLICRQILNLAEMGNVIIVGRGSAILTGSMENCFHFRMYASLAFKVESIARRLDVSLAEAEKTVEKKQQQRDRFIKDFLNRDATDLKYYHLVFNNDRNSFERISETIAHYVLM